MRYLVYLSRILVGSLFIVSGLIKANDPKGFSYKLEEYFAESALNWPDLMPYALVLAILVCFGEIILGFALLFAGKFKLSTITLTLLCIFFMWLTLYTATCNESDTYTIIKNGESITGPVTCVTDCGCFGDAMKGSIGRSLTPWESFYKDLYALILLIPSLFWIVLGKRDYFQLNGKQADVFILVGSLIGVAIWSWIFTWWFPIVFTLIGWALYFLLKKFFGKTKWVEWAMAGAIALLSFTFIGKVTTDVPIRDYRPYAEGKSIADQMKSAEDLGLESPVYATEYTFTNSSTGKDTIVLSNDWLKIYKQPWFAKYEKKSFNGRSILVKEGYEALITDFRLESFEGDDFTHSFLHDPGKKFLFVSYDVSKADSIEVQAFSSIASQLESAGHTVYGASASSENEIEDFRHKHQLAFQYMLGDEKVLKTIIRANPGLILVENGVVLKKWSGGKIPSFEELK